MKYNCSKTLDYDHEVNRMCKTIPTSPIGKCPNCPLANIGGCSPASGLIQRTIDIVQKWSDEHPEKPQLTQEEHDFLASFMYPEKVFIQKGGFATPLDTSYVVGYSIEAIPLKKDMFPFIKESDLWTVEELLKLEVEE